MIYRIILITWWHRVKITNSVIDDKNKIIQELASEQNCYFIDSNTYLKETGYSAEDGVHLSPHTYKKLFEYIKSYMEQKY